MERGACAHGECATRHAALDRHRRGHLPDGVASATRRPLVIFAANSLPGVVNVGPGDYYELIARQTSGSTKNVCCRRAHLVRIEVVE